MPIPRVTENPLTGPDPIINKITAAINVVMFASRIVVFDLEYPLSKANIWFFSYFSSSLILSYIKTLASTAIPTVRIIPAIPGKVKVASNKVKTPSNNNRLKIRVTLAINPNILYLRTMKLITNIKPIMRDKIPALIESCPKSGPTVLSSIIFNGAGKAPDLSSRAKSVADWNVKLPVICPDPPTIGSRMFGALIILPSRTIANLFPTPDKVAFANLFAPTLSKVKETTVS